MPVQLMILGDYMQGLYEFKGWNKSETNYITVVKKLNESKQTYGGNKTFSNKQSSRRKTRRMR